MLPPELQGGDPAAGGGLPPEIMQLLAGGAGGAPQDPAMAGPPPAPEGGASTTDILSEMIELAKQYIDADADEQDKATMTDVLAKLQKYLAAEEKEAQDAMQGKLSPKIMSRAYGG